MTVFIVTCRDGIFAKDGRGWYTSASGRAHGLAWPFPSTLLGAIRTAWGRHQEAKDNRTFTQQDWAKTSDITLGKSLALRAPFSPGNKFSSGSRVWPVPRDALFMEADEEKGLGAAVLRLDPRKLLLPTLGHDDVPARESLWAPRLEDPRKPATPPAWWPNDVFIDWLTFDGESRPQAGANERVGPPQRFQMHVGIDSITFTAADHLLYGYEVLETLEGAPQRDKQTHEWRIACDVSGWEAPPAAVMATLGGDRRPAQFETQEDSELFACPNELVAAFDTDKPRGMRLVVVTPVASGDGWLPQEFTLEGSKYVARNLTGVTVPVILRGAFVGRPQHVSGWDMAQNAAKSTTRLVPPGSVYYLVKQDGDAFTGAEARSLWLNALGTRTEEGFGRVAPGLWIPKEN
jgi:CRISPR-associated protein Cmr3